MKIKSIASLTFSLVMSALLAEDISGKVTYLEEKTIEVTLNRYEQPLFIEWGEIVDQGVKIPDWFSTFQVTYFPILNPNIEFEAWYANYQETAFPSKDKALEAFLEVKAAYPTPEDFKDDERNMSRSKRVILGEVTLEKEGKKSFFALTQSKVNFEEAPYDPDTIRALTYEKTDSKFLIGRVDGKPFKGILMPLTDMGYMEALITNRFCVKGDHSKPVPLQISEESLLYQSLSERKLPKSK